MKAPQRYVNWINKNIGFNPRGQGNSNALSDFVVDDLRQTCPGIKNQLAKKKLVTLKNADIFTKIACRNVDLVLHENQQMPRLSVRLALENKTIMTAHGKARKNRYGDIIAYCNHVHNHSALCVAGALVVVNASDTYENPDAFARGLIRPKFRMQKVVTDTVGIFANIPQRDDPNEPNELPEALGVIVVDYDGVHRAELITEALAPAAKSSIHYDVFLDRLCKLYCRRFAQASTTLGPS